MPRLIFSFLKCASISRIFPIKRSLSTADNAADKKDYEIAIKKLNSLQSNAKTIIQSQIAGPLSHVEQIKKVEATVKYLSRAGISLEALDQLSVIHIAGTKGKGTTAALCESILRHHGYRTGFFSSPHLVEARERIRLDGVPLSHRQFADNLNHIYRILSQKKDNDVDMPAYFKFLTVMAFHVFLREKVDVAVIEVGIGGEYDCTNCIRKPAVVGITTLGLDHTRILGNALPDIAWQKAGIMKPGAVAFTVPQPCPAATDVLLEKSLNRQCPLYCVPPLEKYTWGRMPAMSFTNMIEDVYTSNASLALQLSHEWIKQQSPFKDAESSDTKDGDTMPLAKPFEITHKMAAGLEGCSWPGRTQILHKDKITYFLDGAHTEDSIAYCIRWFLTASTALQTEPEAPRRVLIFNTTGDRASIDFLQALNAGQFDSAFFPAIVPFRNVTAASDHFSTLNDEKISTLQNLCSTWNSLKTSNNSKMFTSVSEAVEDINRSDSPCHVLVTGSVHLVGSALAVLDPQLREPAARVSASLMPLQTVYTTIQAVL